MGSVHKGRSCLKSRASNSENLEMGGKNLCTSFMNAAIRTLTSFFHYFMLFVFLFSPFMLSSVVYTKHSCSHQLDFQVKKERKMKEKQQQKIPFLLEFHIFFAMSLCRVFLFCFSCIVSFYQITSLFTDFFCVLINGIETFP